MIQNTREKGRVTRIKMTEMKVRKTLQGPGPCGEADNMRVLNEVYSDP